MNVSRKDIISVCICTFKRPEMLAITLKGVGSQITDSTFAFEAVIVDNDNMRSAEEIVDGFRKMGCCRIIYDFEPEQSIALARNRTIRNANGNLIATIDDDEFPNPDWLCKMYRCLKNYQADGVLGPVLPHFPSSAPEWLKKSGLCERPRNATGSPVRDRDLRTGNALFNRYVFEKDEKWFDPTRGLTGGSDGEFLSRQIKKGRRFIWCDEAVVFETVSGDRLKAQFYFRRNFRIGTLAGKRNRHFAGIWAVLKNIALFIAYSAILPFSLIAGKHVSMKVLIKVFYNAGSILSAFSLASVQQRK